jgi:hypothetical protein
MPEVKPQGQSNNNILRPVLGMNDVIPGQSKVLVGTTVDSKSVARRGVDPSSSSQTRVVVDRNLSTIVSSQTVEQRCCNTSNNTSSQSDKCICVKTHKPINTHKGDLPLGDNQGRLFNHINMYNHDIPYVDEARNIDIFRNNVSLFVNSKHNTPLHKGGDVKARRHNWLLTIDLLDLCFPSFIKHTLLVRDMLFNGVSFNLSHDMQHIHHKNSRLVDTHHDIVQTTLNTYREMKVLSKPVHTPTTIHPLHVIIKPDKDPRVVLNVAK